MQCDCPAKRLLIASIAYIRGRYDAHQVATNMECCYQGYNSRRKQHQHFVKTPSTALLHYTAGTARQAQTSLTNRSKTPEKRKQEGCCFPHRKGGEGEGECRVPISIMGTLLTAHKHRTYFPMKLLAKLKLGQKSTRRFPKRSSERNKKQIGLHQIYLRKKY